MDVQNKGKWSRDVWIRLGSGACFVIMLTACFVYWGSDKKEPDQVELTASLVMAAQHLLVSNGDAFVWERARFVVNGRYIYEMDLVPRGSISLNLSDFHMENGTAFNPGKDRLRRLEITVPDAYDGRAGYYVW